MIPGLEEPLESSLRPREVKGFSPDHTGFQVLSRACNPAPEELSLDFYHKNTSRFTFITALNSHGSFERVAVIIIIEFIL